ncbi:MAG: dUTP diphosphatase, partial [Elusimicrobia bacterium]|nr:dUTP diphosphatase [Elusimicrobiota bacterium]
MNELPLRRLDPAAVLPTRAHADDAGLDLYGLEDATVAPGEGKLLRTGVAVAIPAGHVGLVCDRSSLAKRGLKTAGGVIDAGYRGEIGVVVWNIS